MPPFCGHGPSMRLVETFRRQGRTEIRYGVAKYLSQLPEDVQEKAFAEVTAEYAAATPLTFTRVRGVSATPENVDIMLTTRDIDGPDGVLADANLPDDRNVEVLSFDASDRWTVDRYRKTLRHEFGHTLGLGHSSDPGDVMAPQLSTATKLQPGDLDALRKLYGPPRQPAPPPAPAPAPAPTPPAPPRPAPPANPAPGALDWARILFDLMRQGENVNFTLNKEQWIKFGKGAAIAGAAGALVYASENLAGLDFGPQTPLVVAVLSIVINYARKALTTPAAPQ